MGTQHLLRHVTRGRRSAHPTRVKGLRTGKSNSLKTGDLSGSFGFRKPLRYPPAATTPGSTKEQSTKQG
jgi:hypothetical protein